ncbi:MAG: sulfite exporter TauE/SafE family protein [Saprospiraceae bacterium]|nr:sulfite exporter TauE/SafE family protein [Saprospiraceae bacterium]
MSTAAIAAVVFIISFLFALGGVGSAVVLVPILDFLGLPFEEARATALYVNAVTLFAASYSNWRGKHLDFSVGLPVLIASIAAAPLGAWLSTSIDQQWVSLFFASFLLLAGIAILLAGDRPTTLSRRSHPLLLGLAVGFAAGFLSGFLGIGGGGLIATAFILVGYDPKFAVVTTAFVVPFSSATGFASYATLGHFNWQLALPLGGVAIFSGLVATSIMHDRISSGNLKWAFGLGLAVLGAVLLVRELM